MYIYISTYIYIYILYRQGITIADVPLERICSLHSLLALPYIFYMFQKPDVPIPVDLSLNTIPFWQAISLDSNIRSKVTRGKMMLATDAEVWGSTNNSAVLQLGWYTSRHVRCCNQNSSYTVIII